jgi:predicted nicotinamide N-methyase
MSALGNSTVTDNALLRELAQLRRERAPQRKSERVIELRNSVGGPVAIRVEQRVAASLGSQLGGAAACLCAYLDALADTRDADAAPIAHSAHVLELGAGTGAVGIACAALFAEARVVLTDRESQRELIELNLAHNSRALGAEDAPRARFVALDWTDHAALTALLAEVPRGGFTHVIMSDVLSSDRAQFDPLVRALARLTSPGSVVFFAHTSSAEDAAHPQLALLARSTERQTTPLQDFLKLIEAQFNVVNVQRNRLWLFTRRSGAWLTTDGAFATTTATTTTTTT